MLTRRTKAALSTQNSIFQQAIRVEKHQERTPMSARSATKKKVKKPSEKKLSTQELVAITEMYSATNYRPLPVVITRAQGVWVWDCDGKKYLDFLSAYSAINQGHRHPVIVRALIKQAGRVTLTSRAFYNDKLGLFMKDICELAGMEKALPMNSGAEAVETAIKTARKWGYLVKHVPENQAEIICCDGNFHGRTTTIVSFSTDRQYHDNFGPYTPGFKIIPFGDSQALEKAITPNTVAFLVEPIQGEAGVVVPPEGYLRRAREICTNNNVLLVTDEVQTGLGRTGKMFCFEHEGIRPDMLIIGKAISGGMFPVSVVLSSKEILGVFKPGDHGSTFGGSPLASAVGRASIQVLVKEKLPQRAAELGAAFKTRLETLAGPDRKIKLVRGKGLLLALVLNDNIGPARGYCEKLIEHGMLCKDTHDNIIRLAPPLVIKKKELDLAFKRIADVLE
jgi:ornithine--oxo-acid transaminase